MRRALDELALQADQDGWGALEGTGALKKALYDLERERDKDGGIHPESYAARVNARIAAQDTRQKMPGVPLAVLEAIVAQQYPEPEPSLGEKLDQWKADTWQSLRNLIATEKGNV
jgi:hypothetical protein